MTLTMTLFRLHSKSQCQVGRAANAWPLEEGGKKPEVLSDDVDHDSVSTVSHSAMRAARPVTTWHLKGGGKKPAQQ
jgi:hypothetical protein